MYKSMVNDTFDCNLDSLVNDLYDKNLKDCFTTNNIINASVFVFL